jgi:uncharacterized protein YicC (UPF0701 family)
VKREEIDEIKAHFDQGIGVLRGEMVQLREELRTEFRQETAALGTALRQEMAQLGTDLRRDIREEGDGLRSYVDERVQLLRQEIRTEGDGLRAYIDEKYELLREEIASERRERRVEIQSVEERLGTQIRLVAEGLDFTNARLDQLDLRLDSFGVEMRRGFAGVHAAIHRLHEADDRLDRRLGALEERSSPNP